MRWAVRITTMPERETFLRATHRWKWVARLHARAWAKTRGIWVEATVEPYPFPR